MKGRVFVIDDDADHREAAADLLSAAGHDAVCFASAAEALLVLDAADPGVILTDLRMPEIDGFDLIAALRDHGGDHPVILMTGHGDVAQAVRAIREGAEDFLEKPYDAGHLLLVVDRTLKARETRRELDRLRQAGGASEILGECLGIQALRQRISALATLDVDVIVTGPTGTGKELVARALHSKSPRSAGRYVAINCAALPEALFEAEMFGYAIGAFPGATGEKPGKLELASGGTLVLDEIEAMPLALQAKLLRAIQERALERLGENRVRPLDLRIVAIAKTDLAALTYDGSFRADLFYRIAGAEIRTLPLSEMQEDIPLLFAHFVAQAAARQGLAIPEVGFGARAALRKRAWPGNVRELKAAAERFALGIDAVTPADVRPITGATLADRIAEFEAREISGALQRCRGNTERAAELLGLPRRTLTDKMKRYGL
ncbi:sigma-54-dependent transcriptional regulator [Solirhodobacter olei]|uniref:sigma-54-dependent transcriptional regulator n=1 Tax=Solirhodobacter olei TaxID=2493082 RepID=UPI000FDC65D4|nr:sigma-54 dependent transcriptional regulator [Solirhodobacter olei]